MMLDTKRCVINFAFNDYNKLTILDYFLFARFYFLLFMKKKNLKDILWF